ncbi:uncharacterized protein LOC100374849 [Saccoglossus kowalevskii]|uniref:DNA ligase 1-like n=1 Tax=Saccoglossus kowalevskii TaxID=10224 RepID=A0ABM0GZ72_SACKO|nr:PREDICTED: DNA ligase 1-like [Saccoglossus kowalevskii]
MSKSMSKRNLLKTILDEENEQDKRGLRASTLSEQQRNRTLVKKYGELQQLLLDQYTQSQALLQQQFLQMQQSAAAMLRAESTGNHGLKYSYNSEREHGRERHHRVRSARYDERSKGHTVAKTDTEYKNLAKHVLIKNRPTLQKEKENNDDYFEEVIEAVAMETNVHKDDVSSSSSHYSSDYEREENESYIDDEDSDDEEEEESGNESRRKRVSFSEMMSKAESEFNPRSILIADTPPGRSILKHHLTRQRMEHTHPVDTHKFTLKDEETVRLATNLLSMLHLPATRFGIPPIDPRDSIEKEKPGRPVRRKTKRKERKTPTQSPTPPFSPREPKVFMPSDHDLRSTQNAEILGWLKKKNAALRKQKREQRKKEKRKRNVEKYEMEEKIERLVKAEDLYTDWMKSKKKEELYIRKEQRKQKELEMSRLEEERIEKARRLEELNARVAQKRAAIAAQKKKLKISKRRTEAKKDDEEKDTGGHGDAGVEKEKEENDVSSTVKLDAKRKNRRGKNKVHPMSATYPTRSLSSPSEYRYKRPFSGGTPVKNDRMNGEDRPPLSRYQPKRSTNPMAGMNYDEWLKQKHKDDKHKQLQDEVSKAKNAWSDPDLQNIIPKLAKERIARVTESKFKIDTGLKKSPRDKSQSPQRPTSASTATLTEVPKSEDEGPTSYKWNADITDGKEPRASVDSRPSTAPSMKGRPGASPRKPRPPSTNRPSSTTRKTRVTSTSQIERPEPQGCEIPDGVQKINTDTKHEPVTSNEKKGKKQPKVVTNRTKKEDKETAGQQEEKCETSETNTKDEINQSEEKNVDQSIDSNMELDDKHSEKKKVHFNLSENQEVPPPESESDQRLEDLLQKINIVDDFLRTDGQENVTDDTTENNNTDTDPNVKASCVDDGESHHEQQSKPQNEEKNDIDIVSEEHKGDNLTEQKNSENNSISNDDDDDDDNSKNVADETGNVGTSKANDEEETPAKLEETEFDDNDDIIEGDDIENSDTEKSYDNSKVNVFLTQ